MIGILGAGSALGSRLVTNEELCTNLDVTPEWIVRNTGIQTRYYSDEPVASLALQASEKALEAAHVSPEQIDLTIVATFTHEDQFPAAAAKLHRDLGLTGGMFFDLQANCAGFLAALIVASKFDGYALLVGAEVQHQYMNPSDPSTVPFFGDGAGAVVVGPSTVGFRSYSVWTDSSGYDAVRCGRYECMTQDGPTTGRLALANLPRVVLQAIERAGWTVDGVDLFIFHQANLRLIEFLTGILRVPMSKTFHNVERVGNCSAASIPIAIAEAWPLHGKVVFAAIGTGFGFSAVCMDFA